MWKSLKRILVILIALAFAGALFLTFWPSFGGAPGDASQARINASAHFRDGQFRNVLPPSPPEDGMVWQQIERQFFGDEQRHPLAPIDIERIGASDFAAIQPTQTRVAWLGHSSTLIEIDGIRVLTDPVFSDVAGPTSFAGPERFHPIPFALEELPPIDAVVISHDHYDHLDMETVQFLAAGGTQFLVPLGVSGHLDRWGVSADQITEIAWREHHEIGSVRFVAEEARHYSGRGLFDRRKTQWASWVILGLEEKIYFSGDTGYSGHFRRIGEQYGGFDLTLIKIGAYGPGAAWTDVHMSAEDAVRAHVELQGKAMLPTHWSTFNLGFHDWDEPIKLTRAAAAERGASIIEPRIGEFVTVQQAPPEE